MEKSKIYAESEDGMIRVGIGFTQGGNYKLVIINYLGAEKNYLTQTQEYGMTTLEQAEKRLHKKALAQNLIIKTKA